MKWISPCISLMSGVLAAQYHRLVTVPTLGTGSGCSLQSLGTLCSTSCLSIACCWFTAESFPRHHLARGPELVPGATSSLGSLSKNQSRWSYNGLAPLPQVCTAQKDHPGTQFPPGFTGADWGFDHSCITIQLASLLSHTPFYLLVFCPPVSLLHANSSLGIWFPGTDQRHGPFTI